MERLGYDLGAKFQTYILSEKETGAIKKKKNIASNDFSMNERTDCKISYRHTHNRIFNMSSVYYVSANTTQNSTFFPSFVSFSLHVLHFGAKVFIK